MIPTFIVLALVASETAPVASIYITPDVGIGGNVSEHQYPYMVQIQQFMVVNYVLRCGGTLLTSRCILTAAHCASDELQLRAVVGTVWRDSEAKGQRRPIVRMVAHERYIQDGTIHPYDIALALVEYPFTVDGRHVAVIPLLPVYFGQPEKMDVMGFGKIDHDDTLPARLLVVECSFHPPTDCQEHPSEGTLCVGSPGATACQGDSGGPVVGTIDGIEWLVGVVSFGMKSCGSGPIICTDVNAYSEWIREGVLNLTVGGEIVHQKREENNSQTIDEWV